MSRNLESAKLRALRAKNLLPCQRDLYASALTYSFANVPCVLMCSCVNVPCVLTWLHALRAYVLTCLHAFPAYVLT